MNTEKCYEIFWMMRSSKRAYCPQNSNYQNTVIKLIKRAKRKEHSNTIWNIKIAIKHFASFLNFEANLDFQSSCPKKFIKLSTRLKRDLVLIVRVMFNILASISQAKKQLNLILMMVHTMLWIMFLFFLVLCLQRGLKRYF